MQIISLAVTLLIVHGIPIADAAPPKCFGFKSCFRPSFSVMDDDMEVSQRGIRAPEDFEVVMDGSVAESDTSAKVIHFADDMSKKGGASSSMASTSGDADALNKKERTTSSMASIRERCAFCLEYLGDEINHESSPRNRRSWCVHKHCLDTFNGRTPSAPSTPRSTSSRQSTEVAVRTNYLNSEICRLKVSMSTLLAAAGADFALIKLIRNTLSPEMHGHRKITEGPEIRSLLEKQLAYLKKAFTQQKEVIGNLEAITLQETLRRITGRYGAFIASQQALSLDDPVLREANEYMNSIALQISEEIQILCGEQ